MYRFESIFYIIFSNVHEIYFHIKIFQIFIFKKQTEKYLIYDICLSKNVKLHIATYFC